MAHGQWIIFPPWYVLLLHGVVASVGTALFNTHTRSSDEPEVTPLDGVETQRRKLTPAERAVRNVVRYNFKYDFLCVVKALLTLVVLVYWVDVAGGWRRYTVITLATVTAGHLNVLASLITRAAIEPSSTWTVTSAVQRVVVRFRTMLVIMGVVRKSRPAKVQLPGGQPVPGSSPDDALALDVRTLQVIGSELEEVTYRAGVFTLYGCLAPVLFTHCIPTVVVALPVYAIVATAVVALLRAVRRTLRVLAQDARRSPFMVLLGAIGVRAVAEAVVLFVLQSTVTLPSLLWAHEGALRDVPFDYNSMGGAVSAELALRNADPAQYSGFVAAAGAVGWVDVVGAVL